MTEASPGHSRREILDALARAVDEMDEAGAAGYARRALDAGIDAYQAITEGLSRGMSVVSEKYDKGVYFVPEILLCADAMYAGIEVLRPHLRAEDAGERVPVLIGVIEGDVHDIGKNIVKMMLDAAGFDVHDLGHDVAVQTWIDRARELPGGILAVSTLMSTTMPNIGKLVQALQREGLRDRFRVLVGGGPLSDAFARRIGADAYGPNAMRGVELARKLGRTVKCK